MGLETISAKSEALRTDRLILAPFILFYGLDVSFKVVAVKEERYGGDAAGPAIERLPKVG